MLNILKNKTVTILTAFMFMVIGFTIGYTPKVEAKLNNTAFWGILPNFSASTFEGYVIENEGDSYIEKTHSVMYGTGTDVPLNKLRVTLTGSNARDMTNITSPAVYNVFYLIAHQGNEKNHVYTQFKKSDIDKGLYLKSGTFTDKNVKQFYDNSAAKLESDTFQGDIIANKWLSGWDYETSAGDLNAADLRKKNSVYTWPSWQDAGDVSQLELKYVTSLNTTMIREYNNTLSTILNSNQRKFVPASSTVERAIFLDFAAQVANAAENPGTWYTYNVEVSTDNGKRGINVSYRFVKMTEVSDAYQDIVGIKATDNVKLQVKTGENKKEINEIIVLRRYPKGYGTDQALLSELISRKGGDYLTEKTKDYGYTDRISFGHIAYQAIFNYETTMKDSTGAIDLYPKSGNGITNWIAKVVAGALSGLTGLLNLFSLEELMLNEGTRAVTYWQGVFPATWFSASQYFYLFTFTLSMIMLIISMVKLAGTKAASTIGNVAKKISLMEGIKRLILCSIAVILFVPIFTIFVQLNFAIVEALKTLIPEGSSLNFTVSTVSNMGLAGALIAITIFWITIRMNVSYLLRGITILLCYILGPIAIMCSAMGEKMAQITTNWLKELVGNLFIQSVHALIMMVYITVAGQGGGMSLERIVLVYSFIPLTEFVRTNLFGLGKGLDQVAENFSEGIRATTTAAAAGALAAGGTALLNKSQGKSVTGTPLSSKGESTGMNVGGGLETGKVGSKAGQIAKRTTLGALGGAMKLASFGAGVGGMMGSGAMNASGKMSPDAMRMTSAMAASAAGNIIGNTADFANGIKNIPDYNDVGYDNAVTANNIEKIKNLEAGDFYNGGNVAMDSVQDQYDGLMNRANSDAEKQQIQNDFKQMGYNVVGESDGYNGRLIDNNSRAENGAIIHKAGFDKNNQQLLGNVNASKSNYLNTHSNKTEGDKVRSQYDKISNNRKHQSEMQSLRDQATKDNATFNSSIKARLLML